MFFNTGFLNYMNFWGLPMNFGFSNPSFSYPSFNNSNFNAPIFSFNNNNIFKYTLASTSNYDFGFKSSAPKATAASVAPISVTKTTDRNFVNKSNLDAEFLNKTKSVAKTLNCDYKDLLALMNSESGLNPQAAYKNASGNATAIGLIQFTQPAINELNKKYGLNLTFGQIRSMSAMQQLDITEKYLSIAKSYTFAKDAKLSASDLYAITFLPGRANRETLCQSNEGNTFYSANRGLDKNKDGQITKSDLANHLARKQVDERLFA